MPDTHTPDQPDLYELQEINLLHEVVTDAKKPGHRLPALMDINKLNVALLLDKLDTTVPEDFKIDKDKEFHGQWETLMKRRNTTRVQAKCC